MHVDIAYCGHTEYRPCFYANDHSRDTVVVAVQAMEMFNGRDIQPSLTIEGFKLVDHKSAVQDFTDRGDVSDVHPAEIEALLLRETGADLVIVNGPGVLRFSERSGKAGSLDNSMPARFAHVDITNATARDFAARSAPEGKRVARFAHYNVWRAFSAPPQDVPLAVCDTRTVSAADLIKADAIFDLKDGPEWSFEAWNVAYNPNHRWHWFPDMTRDEVIIFKTSDSDPAAPQCVPHVAFDDPDAPHDCPARSSIEMRAIAYWFD